MKKIILLSILTLSFSFQSFAQLPEPSGPVAKKCIFGEDTNFLDEELDKENGVFQNLSRVQVVDKNWDRLIDALKFDYVYSGLRGTSKIPSIRKAVSIFDKEAKEGNTGMKLFVYSNPGSKYNGRNYVYTYGFPGDNEAGVISEISETSDNGRNYTYSFYPVAEVGDGFIDKCLRKY